LTMRFVSQMHFKVSVLFNEPKLLKSSRTSKRAPARTSFSALQRAEIAEMGVLCRVNSFRTCFSALQRAEIAEIELVRCVSRSARCVSVLFNEPKLLKSPTLIIAKRPKHAFQCSSTSRNC